jgi:ankyrin repeat protein
LSAVLANGADVNAKRSDGVTALMAASFGGDKEMVQLLLAKGCSDAKDNDGDTALTVASHRGNSEKNCSKGQGQNNRVDA